MMRDSNAFLAAALPRLYTPTMTGVANDWTPPGDCLSIRAEGAEYRIEVYPGAVPSFDLDVERQEYLGRLVGYDGGLVSSGRFGP